MNRVLISTACACLFLAGCGQSEPENITAQAPPTAPTDDHLELPPQSEPPLIPGPDEVEPATGGSVTQTAFDKLCQSYATGDADGWAKAERNVLAAGVEAEPVLLAALAGGANHERELAASMLVQLGANSESARAALRKALEDESTFVRSNAVSALCAIGDQTEALMLALKQQLGSEEAADRAMAAMAASNLGESAEPVIPAIIELLADSDTEARRAAAESLGRLGPSCSAAIEKLEVIAAEDADDVIRKSATTAIALIRGQVSEDSGGVIIPASSTRSADK